MTDTFYFGTSTATLTNYTLASLTIGSGDVLTQVRKGIVSLSAGTIAAQSCSDVSFSVATIFAGSTIVVCGDASALGASISIGGAWYIGTLKANVRFLNSTSATAYGSAGSFTFLVVS